MIRALLLAVLALTVDLLWGYTGILTFGQSAFFGIGAYACALVFSHLGFGAGWGLLALLLGIVAAMAVAALVGWLAFYHGASPLYGSIVTLALPIVLTQIVFSGGNFTGSSSGLSGFPTFYWSLETWFWLAGALLVAVTGGCLAVRAQRPGPRPGRDPRERGAVRLPRHSGVADQDPADGRARRAWLRSPASATPCSPTWWRRS